MGWFDEQIKQRMKADADVFSDAMAEVVDVINKNTAYDFNPHASGIQAATDVILKYYHVKHVEIPTEISDFDERLEHLLSPSGIMRRRVKLEGAWYRDATGAFLGSLQDGTPVALLPDKISGYRYYQHNTGELVRVNKKTAQLFKEEAVCFYRPLPLKKLKIPDLLLFILKTLSVADYALIGIASLATTLIGMLNPILNNILFSTVIETNSISLLASVGVMLVSVSVTIRLIGIAGDFLNSRVQSKTNIAVESAAMMRLLSLPTKFFGDYNTGEVSMRLGGLQNLCVLLGEAFFTTGLSAVFSLLYIGQIFMYAPALLVPSLCITLSTICLSAVSMLVQIKLSKRRMELDAKQSGLTYALVNGVQKLKLSGSEKRAFSKWANIYHDNAQIQYNPPTFIKFNSVISHAINLTGTFALYYFAVQSKVSPADYFAFQAAYGMASGALTTLYGMVARFSTIKPTLDMVQPILASVPETGGNKRVIAQLNGKVELCNISFAYDGNSAIVLNNLSLKIEPGQYVAIVGKTGCGKSTLVRLMLGFETPQNGAIYYDNQDITTLDLRSLRRRIGTVLQNGKLSAADVFSNITIAAPWLTMEQAWEAAELAGIAEDIRAMPMGMLTLLSEGSGGISGGQRQRLMIARAVAAKPNLLILDEATSALDNITQKAVVASLAGLKCTRIVIAHRLSTIKECDRIIFLGDGHIVEDGSYAELLAKKGEFAQLVAHQQLED